MGRWFRDLDRILRGDATRLSGLNKGTIDVSIGGLALVLVVLAMSYGACMGMFALTNAGGTGLMQVIASMVKVPALFVLTLAVTLPSLYVTNALVGSRLTADAVVRLLLSALGVMIAMLASMGPIVSFFSFSTTSYPFMVLVNVAVFAISGALGLSFLLQTLQRINDAMRLPPARELEVAGEPVPEAVPPGALDRAEGQMLGRDVKLIFRCWILLFGVVGAQMAWVLRPFIGSPDRPFSWFRPRESNFFQAVWEHVLGLFA